MSNPDDTQPSSPSPWQRPQPPARPDAAPPYQPLYPPTPPTRPAAAIPPPPPPVAAPPPRIPPAGPPTAPMAGTPPPGVPPRTVVRHERQSRRNALGVLALACFLTLAAVFGYSIGTNNGSNSSIVSNTFPTQQIPQTDPNTGFPSNGSNGSSSNGQQANVDVQSIAEKVSPSVVNLVSAVGGGEAAGTGIIISSDGLALTNNHVIASSTELQAELNGNGEYHSVKVLGYDIEHDVALVQIEDVSDLTPASLGDTSSVQVGDAIVALGNAGGKGGDPTVVSGIVTATEQQITAADEHGGRAETLYNLVQIDANIQPGDSGGPLVDANGDVIGMNAAASSGNGGFGFGGQSANEGYAIPIEDALAIAEKIRSGQGGDTIHVGAHAAIIGVEVSDSGYGDPYGSNGDLGGSADGSGNGAYVENVQDGSGAADAGIRQGSTITAVDGDAVSSASGLTHLMVPYQPGDKVKVEWTDPSGESHSATIELGSGPPN
jgi:S1-C subfamily serine protease